MTPDQMRTGIDRLKKRLDELSKFKPTSIVEQYNIPEVDGLSAAIDDALVRTFGADSIEYDRYRHASDFDNGPHNYAYSVPISDVHESLARSQQRNIALIKQAINSLEEQLAELGNIAVPTAQPVATKSNDNRNVFVVHGHAGVEEAVARFLAKISFNPIILHEQANQGSTIIEKFERHSGVGFAVVLLTDDDIGGSKGGAQSPRARQNVVLELGYFIGKLGRERVCALKKGNIELPSDIFGVLWTELDEKAAWKVSLAKELQAAGYEVDWNKVMS